MYMYMYMHGTCTNAWLFGFQMRCEQGHTDSCSTLSSSSRERRMPPTTTHEVTTQSEKRSSTWFWIALENSWVQMSSDMWLAQNLPRRVLGGPMFRPARVFDLPLVRRRHWVGIHVAADGETLGRLRKEIKIRICRLPCTTGEHN